MYYMIIMLKFMEPEAEVKLVQNFCYKIYLACKEVLQPAPVNSLRLRLRLRRLIHRSNHLETENVLVLNSLCLIEFVFL